MSELLTNLFKNGVYKHLFGYLGSLVFDLVLVLVFFGVLSWVLRSLILGVLYERLKGVYNAFELKEGSNNQKIVLNVVGGLILLLVGYYFGYYLNLSSFESNIDSMIIIDNVLTTYRLLARLFILALAGVYALMLYCIWSIRTRKGFISVRLEKGCLLFSRFLAFSSCVIMVLAYLSAFWLLIGTFK